MDPGTGRWSLREAVAIQKEKVPRTSSHGGVTETVGPKDCHWT